MSNLIVNCAKKYENMEVNPLAIILVYLDSKGDRLLYRYPYQQQTQQQHPQLQQQSSVTSNGHGSTLDIKNAIQQQPQQQQNQANFNAAFEPKKRNPFAMNTTDDLLQTPPPNASSICVSKGQLQGFADEVLSTLFAVKQQLCNQKFELKVNDVRFVSHPTLVQRREQQANAQQPQQRALSNTALSTLSGIGALAGSTLTISSIGSVSSTTTTTTNTSVSTAPATSTPTPSNVSTTATSSAPANSTTSSTGTAAKPLPQQMLINIVFALHAQASYSIVKCYYELSKRIGLALKVEENRIGYLSEETAIMARTHDEISTQQQPLIRAFELITDRCSLAQAMKSMYHDLCTTGLLNTTLNQNLTLSFCLPQKAHQLHKKGSMVDPETIASCLHSLKPYHGMLLLVDFAELLDCVPPTGARMLLQLVEVYTPLMSLQNMASEADLSIEYVYKLVSHLVYYAKATIIYPLCETNVYVIAPDAPLHTKSHLVEKFSTRFAGMSLFEVISDFSLPTSIGHLTTPLQQPARQGILAQMVLWMLQHHLLMQLHTYVQFMPSDMDEIDCTDCVDENGVALMNCMHTAPEDNNIGSAADDIMLGSRSDDDADEEVGDDEDDVDDELNAGSLLSISSQPLPVPHTSRRSLTEDHYSVDGSTASDNIAAQPSSSHKSNFSMTASLSTENCGSIASIEDEEKVKELLQVFNDADRAAIRRIPASMNVDDLSLLVKLYQAGYFKSEHHLEEIMYFENLRRSQLLQLLDKFRDVLIIYETEDPAIVSMYNTHK